MSDSEGQRISFQGKVIGGAEIQPEAGVVWRGGNQTSNLSVSTSGRQVIEFIVVGGSHEDMLQMREVGVQVRKAK